MSNQALDKNHEQIINELKQIMRIFDKYEVVLGVWPDAGEPYGIGTMIVKGAGLLQEIAADGKARATTTIALPCVEYEQAQEVKEAYGDQE
jgi:hypothetical protein